MGHDEIRIDRDRLIEHLAGLVKRAVLRGGDSLNVPGVCLRRRDVNGARCARRSEHAHGGDRQQHNAERRRPKPARPYTGVNRSSFQRVEELGGGLVSLIRLFRKQFQNDAIQRRIDAPV